MNGFKKDFRKPKYLDRYEYVTFELETSIIFPQATQQQQLTGYRFVVDGVSEEDPFDWYNAFIKVQFRVNEIAAGAQIQAADNTSTVNSIYSFFQQMIVNINGVTVNDSPNINQCCHIKNLLDFSKPYKNVAVNSFYYYDKRVTTDAVWADDAARLDDGYNISGFMKRHQEIVGNNLVDATLSLNRYGFFESLKEKICPQGKVTITMTLESTDNLIYRDGGNHARVVIRRMTLHVPKLIFKNDAQKLFFENFLSPHKWIFMNEKFEPGSPTQAVQGTWSLTSAISKPRDVFIWAIHSNHLGNQEENIFFHNTFDLSPNHVSLAACQLEVGGGNFYPIQEFNPNDNPALVYRMLMAYNRSYNDYLTGSQISLKEFINLYGMVYSDIRNQPDSLLDGTVKLTFRWRLTQAADENFTWFAVILNEEEIKVVTRSNKAFITK